MKIYMKTLYKTIFLLAVGALWMGIGAPLRATIIFNNSVHDETNRFDPGTTEVGDEIILQGPERYLTNFSFEFWGTNSIISSSNSTSFNGSVSACVRFYQNNGPLFNGYRSPVDEQHHEYGQGQAPADGFLAQQRTKLLEWPHSGHVSGGVGIADGMAFGIDLVLCENAPQVSHPRFGLAVGTFAFPALQFLWPHGHARGVATEIHDGCRLGAGQRRQGLAFLPGLRAGPHALDQSLDLPGRDLNAAGLFQVLVGLLVAGFIGPLQAHQPRQGRRATPLQSQGGIGRIVPLLLARMIVIVPFQGEEPEDTIDR